ncbi:MAG: hypothetical protein KA745_00035 [Gemmatimonadales bacterium]|nr:hypothetical protein [Gemmatimonadales bacterium]
MTRRGFLEWIAAVAGHALAIAVGGALAIAVGGALAIGVGQPLAWRIDRASYDWAAAAPGGEDEGDAWRLPSYEMTPAAPSALAEARR